MTRSMLAAAAFLAGAAPLLAQTPSGWRAQDPARPLPPVVTPGAAAQPVPAPSDALVLFDGSGLDAWRNRKGDPAGWVVRNGAMEAVPGAGYVYSRRDFGDIQLHIEWATPTPPHDTGQGRGNSGVFLMGTYELQVLDSYHNDTYPDGQAGAAYGQYPPLINASLPPGEWQSYDIVFRRPRFDAKGALVEPARVTAFQNGVLIQDGVRFWGPTEWLQAGRYDPARTRGPIGLQDHGNPVRYRNIWVRELPEGPAAPPPPLPAAVPQPASVLNALVGTYSDGDITLVITRHRSGLEVDLGAGRTQRLIPLSPTTYAFSVTAATLEVTSGSSGHPEKVTFRMEPTVAVLMPVHKQE